MYVFHQNLLSSTGQLRILFGGCLDPIFGHQTNQIRPPLSWGINLEHDF